MRTAPQGMHDALDQLVSQMAEANETYGEARVRWVQAPGEPELLTLLTIDLEPSGGGPVIVWICARLGHRVRLYGPQGCACHCLCNRGWLEEE